MIALCICEKIRYLYKKLMVRGWYSGASWIKAVKCMKMKSICFVLLCSVSSLLAQVSNPRNAFSMELGGSAGHQSINYTRLPKGASGFSPEIGIGLVYGQNPTLAVPMGISYLRRRSEKSLWRYGLGLTFTQLEFISLAGNQPDDKDLYMYFVPSVVYQRTFPDGFFWGLKLSPFFGDGGGILWGGVQLGFFL